jgi:hypothetical protein
VGAFESKYSGIFAVLIVLSYSIYFFNSDLLGSRSVYQMIFSEASTTNYAMIENIFPNNIKSFSACFWAKILKTKCGIFAYSTATHVEEISAYLDNNDKLRFTIKNYWRIRTGLVLTLYFIG